MNKFLSIALLLIIGLTTNAQDKKAKILNIAHQYQQTTDWHKQTPKGFA